CLAICAHDEAVRPNPGGAEGLLRKNRISEIGSGVMASRVERKKAPLRAGLKVRDRPNKWTIANVSARRGRVVAGAMSIVNGFETFSSGRELFGKVAPPGSETPPTKEVTESSHREPLDSEESRGLSLFSIEPWPLTPPAGAGCPRPLARLDAARWRAERKKKPPGEGGAKASWRCPMRESYGQIERIPKQGRRQECRASGYTKRTRRLSSITLAPCRNVMGVPGQRWQAARNVASATSK